MSLNTFRPALPVQADTPIPEPVSRPARYNGCPIKSARTAADTSPMNPLVLSDADYKAVFERITHLALEYVASVSDRPSFPKITGSETEALFAKSLPEQGMGNRALDDLDRVIEFVRVTNPRFFGYVLGSGAVSYTHLRAHETVLDL